MKPGYLYVLIHPSDPTLYKIGQTTCHPDVRLAQHNSDHEKYAGQVVRDTGQKWELKTSIAVPDPRWAEKVFWNTFPFHLKPAFNGGIEVQRLDWEWVQVGLDAAKNAGVRPPPGPVPDYVYVCTAWMKKRLEGRGITLLSHTRSKSGKSEFRCTNGHVWRTWSKAIAEGEGCPECGIGYRSPDEIRQLVNHGILCLLVKLEKPGFVKIGLTYDKLDRCLADRFWGEWKVHRYRRTDEVKLAVSILWEKLGHPPMNECEMVQVPIAAAEQAFRDMNIQLQNEIALREKERGLLLNSIPPH